MALRNALLALAAVCALYGIAKGGGARPRLPPWRVLAPIVAWTAWCVASVAWSVEPAYSISELRPGLLYPSIAFLRVLRGHDGCRRHRSLGMGPFRGARHPGPRGGLPDGHHGNGGIPQRWHGDAGGYATHVVLALPLLAWAFLRTAPQARATRLALGAVALLTLVVTSWNDNRIAWVALAGMTVLAVFLSRDSLAGPQRARIIAFAAAALVAFSALFVLAIHQRA